MANQLPEYQVARFFQNSVVIYNVIEFPPRKTDKQKENEKNLTRGQFNGFLSIKAKSKIKKIISPWLNSIFEFRKGKIKTKLQKSPYPTFITLTLSSAQKHDDCQIKRECLNPFLINLQRKFNVRHYFWICETQNNGNLHFHIIIDSYVPHPEVRKLWNQAQERLGYITAFTKAHHHANPNSTDIHSIRHIDSIESYVMKYVQKGGGSRIIRGKIWDCSKSLKSAPLLEVIPDHETTAFINKLGQSAHFRKYIDENVTVFTGDVYGFSSVHCKAIHQKYLENWSEHLQNLYGYQKPIIETLQPAEEVSTHYDRKINVPSAQLEIICPF